MPPPRRTRLGFLAPIVGLVGLGPGLSGCDSTSGASSPAIIEKKEDLEKREKAIKELYKARKSGPIRARR